MTPRNVLYMTAEDGLADTLRPRLDKMGANVEKIYAISSEYNGLVTLQDTDTIKRFLEEIKPALVVIDPLQAYLGGHVDMHRANEVRPILSQLANLAEEFNAAIVCIRHLNKGGGKAMYRGMGSIDFTAAARSVILVGQDAEDPNKRAFVHMKSSLAPKGPAMGYTINEEGQFQWTGVSELGVDDLLDFKNNSKEEQSEIDEAIDFLEEIMNDDSHRKESKIIIAEAKKTGIAERTLKRAKSKLNISSGRVDIPIDEKEGKWKNVWVWQYKEPENN